MTPKFIVYDPNVDVYHCDNYDVNNRTSVIEYAKLYATYEQAEAFILSTESYRFKFAEIRKIYTRD